MEYVVVYQDRQQLQAYRRIDNNNWELEVLIRGDTLTLSSLQKPLVVPLDIIYERYDPPSRVKEDEAEYDFDPLDPLDSLV
jgi:Uma2 family endonuclease